MEDQSGKSPRGVFNKKIVIKKLKKENNNKKNCQEKHKKKRTTTKKPQNKTKPMVKIITLNNKKAEIEIGLCSRFFFFQKNVFLPLTKLKRGNNIQINR